MSRLFSPYSLGATIVILVLGLGLGSKQVSELKELKELQQRPQTIGPESGSNTPSRTRSISQAQGAADEVINKLADLEPYGKKDPSLDLKTQDAFFKIQIATLPSSQLEKVIDHLMGSEPPLSTSETRIFRYALLALADEHPVKTLDLVKTALSLPAFPKTSEFRSAISQALTNLNLSDLHRVDEWFQSGPKIRGLRASTVITKLFSRQAGADYPEAFRLVGQELKDPEHQAAAVKGIRASLTQESASEFLSALRRSTLSSDLKNNALEKIGTGNVWPDVHTTTAWMLENNFTREELNAVLNGLYRRGSGREEEWIAWLTQDSIDMGKFSNTHKRALQNLLSSLIRQDFVKAGNLINSLPSKSKAQNFAESQYSLQIRSVDQKAAIDWFLSLDPGPTRTTTGQILYHELFRKDPLAAEEFARKGKLYLDQ